MSKVQILQDDREHWKYRTGCGLRGYIDISYQELFDRFGEPGEGDAFKTSAEWVLLIDGTVVTIYNWKDGPTYPGTRKRIEDIRDWHIGGKDHEGKAVAAIQEIFPDHKVISSDTNNPVHLAKTMIGS